MTQDVLWMSETYFKDNSILNDNVDWKVVQPIMIMVQDQNIRPILGTALFDEIADQIYSHTETAANTTLLNLYVRKCIIYYVLSELAPALKYRYHNKGVMVRNSENSQAASLDEIQFEISRWKQKAEQQAEYVTKYLIQNNTTYPLYYNGNTDIDDVFPNKTNFTSSLYLGDKKDEGKCRNPNYYR